ncbi:MAG: hypothetical protein V3V09_05240 [Arenicellales bacterium]
MPSLQVRELPENIYRLLQQQAMAEHRSLAQEAIVVLAKGLNSSLTPQARRASLLQKIEAQASNSQKVLSLDPAELIREDRDR